MQSPRTSAPSFGAELQRERIVRKVSLEEISAATKISVGLLSALERSEFAKLPAPVFTRGFIRAYCLHLGLDPVEKINAYLAEFRPKPSEPCRSTSAGTFAAWP